MNFDEMFEIMEGGLTNNLVVQGFHDRETTLERIEAVIKEAAAQQVQLKERLERLAQVEEFFIDLKYAVKETTIVHNGVPIAVRWDHDVQPFESGVISIASEQAFETKYVRFYRNQRDGISWGYFLGQGPHALTPMGSSFPSFEVVQQKAIEFLVGA